MWSVGRLAFRVLFLEVPRGWRGDFLFGVGELIGGYVIARI